MFSTVDADVFYFGVAVVSVILKLFVATTP